MFKFTLRDSPVAGIVLEAGRLTQESPRTMSSHYEEVRRDGQTLDILTDEASGTRLSVARPGAAPVSFARRGAEGAWTGFLWRDDDLSKPREGWNGHCTVMGYYLHRLKDGKSFYRGHEIEGGTHSFLRTKEFPPPMIDTEAEGGPSMTYLMPSGGYTPLEYPYRVTMKLTYTLEKDGAWRTRFHFDSGEPDISTHVSFGLHPGFALGSLEEAQVLLPAGRYRRLMAPGNFLSGQTEGIDHHGGPMPFDKGDLPGSFLLEPIDVEFPVYTVVDPVGGRRVELDLAQAPYVTIWSDGHDFVCVEPCWGLPDAIDPVPFEKKLGIQEMAPGGSLEREFVIRASAA